MARSRGGLHSTTCYCGPRIHDFGVSLPEVVASPLYGNTFLQGLAPCMSLVAFSLGYLCNYRVRSRSGLFVWVPVLMLFYLQLFALLILPSPGWLQVPKGTWVFDNVFAIRPVCSGSECLEALPTMALSCSIGYSLGFLYALRRGNPTT